MEKNQNWWCNWFQAIQKIRPDNKEQVHTNAKLCKHCIELRALCNFLEKKFRPSDRMGLCHKLLNKMIEENECTIVSHVNDLKDHVINLIKSEFEK